MLSEILKEFHTYLKTKHPKSKVSVFKTSKTVLHEYLTFVKEILAPRYGLENIEIKILKEKLPTIFICQKLPNTGLLWILYKEASPSYQIPSTLIDIPNFLLYLRKKIEENRAIMDIIDLLSPEDDDNEWTDVKVWQYLLYTVIKHLDRKYPEFTRQQAINALHFIENAILGKKETFEIPSYLYAPTLSEILADKLAKYRTEVFFAELNKHLIPICHIYNHYITLLFPDMPTKKQITVNIKKIDEFDRTTNEYLKKVHSRVKTTVKTLSVAKNLLQ